MKRTERSCYLWRFSSFARSRLQCYCNRKYKELFRSQCPGEHFQLHYRGTKVKGQKHWARVRGAGLQQRARQLLCLATGSTFSLGLRFLLSKNRELTAQGWPGRRGGVFYWSFFYKLSFHLGVTCLNQGLKARFYYFICCLWKCFGFMK